MKEIVTRSLSGLFYVLLLLLSLKFQLALVILFYVFGMICLLELNRLIALKSLVPYFIFTLLYFVFGYWQLILNSTKGLDEATQILMVISIFVNLILIKDLFSQRRSEEHTSELQSRENLVCRLLLEKK